MNYLAVGCSDYKYCTKLKYIENDLETMKSGLEFAGFTGTTVMNCSRDVLLKEIQIMANQVNDIT